MLVEVLKNDIKNYSKSFKEDLLLLWKEATLSDGSYCLVKDCSKRNTIEGILVRSEKGSQGVVPMCKDHSRCETTLDLEQYAKILSTSTIIEEQD